MVENTQSYIPSTLKFSPSKLYFQHQNQILQKFGFISPMTIDVHFKYSFQEIHENYFIEGGEFEGITADHDAHEQGIIYKIGFLHPKFNGIKNLSVDLKKNYLDNPSLWPLFIGLFGRFVVFFVLLKFKENPIGRVLFRLNLIGALILLAFYGWKIGKVLYKKFFETKSADYGGLLVGYSNSSDASLLSTNVIGILKKMGEEYWITKLCYTGNCIYLLQDIHDHEGKRIDSNAKIYSEQEKATLQQKTMEFIRQSDFLSYFM